MFRDGNQWCVMIGADLQAGVGGFGATIAEALRDLARLVDWEGWTLDEKTCRWSAHLRKQMT